MRAWMLLLLAGCGRLGFDDVDEAYTAAVLADTPLGYWKLDETSGAIARDSSGNGHDLQRAGQFTMVPGVIGGAMRMTAGGIPNDGGHVGEVGMFQFNGTAAFALECSINPDALGATWRQVFNTDNWDPTVRREGYSLEYMDDHIHFVRRRDDVDERANAPSALAVGQWHHVVGTYDGAMVRIYVNGVERDAQPSALQIASKVDTPFSVSDDRYTVTGIVDDCAIYEHALSPERVADHHAAAQ